MFRKYHENDNFKVPNKYERMSKEHLEKRIRFYELFMKLHPKRKKTKLQSDINFYF